MCLARSPWDMCLNCAKLFSRHVYRYVGVVNEAKIIHLLLLGSKKIDKNLGGRLELLTKYTNSSSRSVLWLSSLIGLQLSSNAEFSYKIE